ncbi:hypothetical protein JANAI62_21890 [Jannaschia pagri]|uniref:Protein kinase domain-containing protein n=1 Tax=Jannaschia pagri TaxID=2829797 RepID=A0ABQ4NMH9_9RHOB|nr:hypothetical protein JANAI61_21900 [Jannaschia sp. AI_61]GIT95566.1 hypothetical protein JANAI62_21890 [Jannaschia sp. AI_62]
MSKWQTHAEMCGIKAAERLYEVDPSATREIRDTDMWGAGVVLLTFLRDHHAPEYEIAEAMSIMLRAYVTRFQSLKSGGVP